MGWWFNGSMKSKERVLTALATREPDRVPINYYSNPGIDLRMKKHFGLKHDDDEGLRRRSASISAISGRRTGVQIACGHSGAGREGLA